MYNEEVRIINAGSDAPSKPCFLTFEGRMDLIWGKLDAYSIFKVIIQQTTVRHKLFFTVRSVELLTGIKEIHFSETAVNHLHNIKCNY